MTPTVPPPRHLLVIAPHCLDQGPLDGLEEVAHSLCDAFLNPWVGRCEEAPQGVASLLCGPSVDQAQIEKAVRHAARRAGEAGAVLVLAIIGHGTTHGGIPKLFLMAGDSRQDEPTTHVNVGELLAQALDTQGVQGIVALVDTCHAGGAAPDIDALRAGIRRGATRLSLLMSVGVNESCHGLRFTRGLVRVLREGVSGAGARLSADDVRNAVNRTTETAAHLMVTDGDPDSEPHAWVALNSRQVPASGPLLGPIGDAELRAALEPLGKDRPSVRPATPADLEDLRDMLGAAKPCDAETDENTSYALSVIDGLLCTIRTASLLLDWQGAPLTSERIRRAARAAGGSEACPLGVDGSELLRACLEFLRLRAPRAGGSRTKHLATFLAALGQEDGFGPQTPDLSAWAQAMEAVVELNDAFAALAKEESTSRLRLVVSLHAALADEWPEILVVWLLDRGEQVAYEEFACSPTQAGVERELATVLTWASRHAKRIGARLKRVEIAASAYLLVRWRPEEANPWLRRTCDVVLRWSERLCPPAGLDWINDLARDQLTAMSTEHGGAPVDWLGKPETSPAQELVHRLESGVYKRAVALSHRPDQMDDLMPVLLAYAPIVLWPGDETEVPTVSRDSVDRYWNRLPEEFSEAYRDNRRACAEGKDPRHRKDPTNGRAALARLRSVWHDMEWLDFCDWFETHPTDGENTV